MADVNDIDALNGVNVTEDTAMQMAAEAMGDGMGGGSDVKMQGTDNIDCSGGPPQPPCAPAPPVDMKLFVGRVPQSMDETLLKPVFEEFGEVKEVIIIRDKTTGKHKSSAFVKMASLAQADHSIRALNNLRMLEPNMGAMQVKYATGEAERLGLSPAAGEPGIDQAKLFVGSLPKTVGEEDICNLFAPYGKVDEIFIMKDTTTGAGKGCAFVKFAYKEQALFAIKNLNAKHTIEGCTRPMEVRFAESRSSRVPMQGGMGTVPAQGNRMGGAPGQMGGGAVGGMGGGGQNAVVPNNAAPRAAGAWKEYFTQDGRAYYHNEFTGVTQWDRPVEFDNAFMNHNNACPNNSAGTDLSDFDSSAGPPGANIFVFHIPNEWSQRDLLGAFGGFGNVVSARIATDRHTGRNKGYAFVSYAEAEIAANAVNHMNGFMALNKRLKVTIKKGQEMHVQHLLNNGNGNNTNNNCPVPNANGPPQQQQQWAPYGMCGTSGGYGHGGAQRFTPY